MVTHGFVESVAASLVREYLSRKECKNALKMMDTELPRTEDSIGNRSQLAREVHIEKIMRRNKDATEPFRSMIEVIVKFLMDRATSSKDGEGIPEQKSSTADLGRSERKSSRPSTARRKEGSAQRQTTKGSMAPTSKDNNPIDIQEFSGLPQSDVGIGSLNREATTVITMTSRPSVKPQEDLDLQKDSKTSKDYPILDDKGLRSIPSSSSVKKGEESSHRSKRPGSASRSRGLAGPISSSLDANERRRTSKSSKSPLAATLSTTNVSSSLDTGIATSDLALSSSKKSSSSSRSKLKSFGFDLSPENTLDAVNPPPKAVQRSALEGVEDEKTNGYPSQSLTKEGRSSRHRRSFDEGVDVAGTGSRSSSRHSHHEDAKKSSSSSGAMTMPKKTMTSTTTKKEVSTLGDIEMGDVDDLEEDLRDIQLGSYTPSSRKAIDSRPITLQLAMQLKSLLFGSGTGCFNDEWRLQGLGFNDIAELSYGIVQHKGGPCGVLASVQACMLQRLLFAEGSSQVTAANLKQLSAKKRVDCLIQAICDIVWRAGQKRNAVIALPTASAHFPGGGRYKADRLTECVNLNLFKSREELQEFVGGNIRTFTESRGNGCILLLYSALFSRNIDVIIEDMDVAENNMVGAHGYCTQEMVNLILTGKAVSNVFNDVVELGSGKDITRLKGLSGRSDIGLMSLYEHYKSCQVGTYYKTPRFPIWVVCSESHFSVLFSLKKELIGDWRMERHFDLYYYDGLARQQEEIRLSIDTMQTCPPSDGEDLVPPLEHCIRTKWPEALVDWNGSEPIL